MKINTKAILTDFRGKPYTIEDVEPGADGKPPTKVMRPMTLADAIGTALTSFATNEPISAKVAFERSQLAQKCWTQDEVEITAKQAATIQDLAVKVLSPGAAGAVYALTESAASTDAAAA